AAEQSRPFESRLAMVCGGQVVAPRDHFKKRVRRGIAHADDLIPLLLGAADEDEILPAHPHDARPDLAEHLHGDRAIALVGFARRTRPRAATSTGPTKQSWPSSMPTLKASSAVGISPAGRPTSASAPAKPRPWRSPKTPAIAHGARCIRVGVVRAARASSTARTKTLSAIPTSIGRGGTRASPSAASESVTL